MTVSVLPSRLVIVQVEPFSVAIFPNNPPPATCLAQITGQAGEEVRLGKREVYIHYGDGMAKSKLRIPAAADGTARNMNTIAKLTALAG